MKHFPQGNPPLVCTAAAIQQDKIIPVAAWASDHQMKREMGEIFILSDFANPFQYAGLAGIIP